MPANGLRCCEGLKEARSKGVALLDFCVPWSAPCRLQEAIIGELAEQFHGRAFVGAVNIDAWDELAADLGIRSIPTLILFLNGEEAQRFVGLQSEAVLSRALRRCLEQGSSPGTGSTERLDAAEQAARGAARFRKIPSNHRKRR